MKHTKFIFIIFFTLLIYACISKKITSQYSDGKYPLSSPNIVLILADDLGYGDVGFNGCEDIPTPNIDRIASQGVKFTNGYVSWSACGPSRAGMITGRYQDRFGFSRNPLFTPNDPNMGLPLSEETLADALGRADYKSAILGKWHLGAHESLTPLKRGFDDFFGFLSGGHKYFPELWTLADEFEAKSQYDGYNTKLLRNNERVEENEYITDALSREAVNYIDKYQENPFFIYLAYNAPHGPLQATDRYLERFDHIKNVKRKKYAAMVSAVDDGVGEVLKKLEDLELTENTIVIFLSDNGGPETKNASDNGPLRGAKGDLFEGGIRVPFAMQWLGHIPEGISYHEPVISLDIFSTVIAQSKIPIKTKNELDGVNLMPFLNGERKGKPHDELFWRIFDKEHAVIRSGDNKVFMQKENSLLFNLAHDLAEENDLSSSNAILSEKLQKRFSEWNAEMKDPAFMGLGQNSIYDELHPDRFTRITAKK